MDETWIRYEMSSLQNRMLAIELKQTELFKELKDLRMDMIRIAPLIARYEAHDDLGERKVNEKRFRQ